MDEGKGTGSEAVEEKAPETGAVEGTEEKARSPEEIRQDIEQTREELGDTVASLAEKADVKAQAKRRVDEVKQRASERKDEFVGKAKEASPESAGQFAGQAGVVARENPIPVAAVGAFVGGFLLGRLTKRS